MSETQFKPIEPSAEELLAIVDHAIENFTGNSETLKGAIGYLFLARKFGWKPILLIHNRSTIKAYEKILNIDSREILPDIGEWAGKSIAWKAIDKVTNFWKAVKGETKGARSTELGKLPKRARGS